MPNHDNNDYAMKTVPWDETYQVGTGVDYTTRQSRASILGKFPAIQCMPAAGARSQKVQSVLCRITSKEDLVDKLSAELSGSASVSTPEGGGSGSFFGKFVDEVKVSTYNLYFLLMVQVVNSSEFITDETVKTALRTHLPTSFSNKYGDHLLYGIKTGGLYMALVEIVTRTEEKKQEVTAALGLSGSGPGVPGAGSGGSGKKGAAPDGEGTAEEGKTEEEGKTAEEEVAPGEAADTQGIGATGQLKVMWSKVRTIEDTETRILVKRIGGHGALAVDDLDKLTEQAREFPANVGQHGDVIYAILKPYTLVEGLPDLTIERVLSSQYVQCREKLVRCLLRAQSISENLDYALEPAYRALFAETEQQLQGRRQELAHYIGKVTGLLSELETDPRTFLASPNYQERIPPLLDTSLIPKRLRQLQKQVLAPTGAGSPRALARMLHDVVLTSRQDALALPTRQALEVLGSYLADVFTQLVTAMNRIPWGFQGGARERLDITRRKVEETVRSLDSSFTHELPILLAAVGSELERHKDTLLAAVNDVNVVLSRLQVDAQGHGGLADHVAPLRAAVKELTAVLRLLDQTPLSDVVVCDEQGWALLRQEYEVAVRILGHAVRFGIHKRNELT